MRDRIIVAVTLAMALTVSTGLAAQEIKPGTWGKKADMLEPNSEFATAELNGRIYVLGGYPKGRVTVTTVQVYDIKSDRWTLGPPLPQPNNHGMAAVVNGVLYLIGGQTDPQSAYVDTVYALDAKAGKWVEKARMPTKRSAGVAIPLDGKIYVAGGRPPHGQVFEVYDPKADRWDTLREMPHQRNHIAGAVIHGRIVVAGGRLGGGFQSDKTAVVEAYDPKSGEWLTLAPMPRPRSGINGVMAYGCFHVWGGEHADGMFPDHDYYDPRQNHWFKLADMPVPVHGVTGATFDQGLIWVTGGGTSNGGNSGTTLNQVYRPEEHCE